MGFTFNRRPRRAHLVLTEVFADVAVQLSHLDTGLGNFTWLQKTQNLMRWAGDEEYEQDLLWMSGAYEVALPTRSLRLPFALCLQEDQVLVKGEASSLACEALASAVAHSFNTEMECGWELDSIRARVKNMGPRETLYFGTFIDNLLVALILDEANGKVLASEKLQYELVGFDREANTVSAIATEAGELSSPDFLAYAGVLVKDGADAAREWAQTRQASRASASLPVPAAWVREAHKLDGFCPVGMVRRAFVRAAPSLDVRLEAQGPSLRLA